jgi:hypothetical protein
VDGGDQRRLPLPAPEEFQILGVVERGFAKGLQGAGFGSSGFIVNCPVVFRLL